MNNSHKLNYSNFNVSRGSMEESYEYPYYDCVC